MDIRGRAGCPGMIILHLSTRGCPCRMRDSVTRIKSEIGRTPGTPGVFSWPPTGYSIRRQCCRQRRSNEHVAVRPADPDLAPRRQRINNTAGNPSLLLHAVTKHSHLSPHRAQCSPRSSKLVGKGICCSRRSRHTRQYRSAGRVRWAMGRVR